MSGAPCGFVCEGKRFGEELMDTVNQHWDVQLGSLGGIWLLQSWKPLRVEDCCKRMRSTQVGQEHLCQQAGKPGEESCKQ